MIAGILVAAPAAKAVEMPILLVTGGCPDSFYRSSEGDCRPFASRGFYGAQPTYEDDGEIEYYGPRPQCFVRDTPDGPRRFCAQD